MSWKNWPYWLKGGVIVAGLYFLIGISTLIIDPMVCGLIFCTFPILWIIGTIWDILMMFGLIRMYNIWLFNSMGGLIIGILINSIFFFALGAFIGWIVGKIKSR